MDAVSESYFFWHMSWRRMIQFFGVFQDSQICRLFSRFRELLPLNKPLQREFYPEMCRVEQRSVRTLRQKIGFMLYERPAISKKPEGTCQTGTVYAARARKVVV
ncbi:hypothetical protein JWG88_09655 [Desulfopila inferna]|nr:hypothetical protein [Desulfopila inferna]